MHVGRVVDNDGRAAGEVKWDGVVMVHYPTFKLFAEMTRSTAWNGVVGGKQLGDHAALVTNPVSKL